MQEKIFYFEFQFYNDFISIDYLILLHLYRLLRKVTIERGIGSWEDFLHVFQISKKTIKV